MHTHRLPPSIRQLLWLILAIAVAFAAAIWPALAHDPAHPEWNQWLLDQRNQNDAVCCDGQDTLVLSDNEWRMGNGHYEVLYDGAWHEVPDWALTKSQGNITGSALLWVLSGSVRCFKPGTFY